MVTGRRTLEDLRRAYGEERARLRDVDARLAKANERSVELDAARADRLAELARLRVGDAAGPAPEGDERVAAMLRRREATRAAFEGRLRELDATVARLEDGRETLVGALATATDELDAAEAATQARLAEDPAYRAARDRAHELERTVQGAAEKADASEQERAEKGRAYEEDPFFTYLWRRGYGTDRYRAWPLTRWLDRKVARLVGYDTARADYARLVELPVRLREHADAMAADAEAAFEELRRLDEEARAEDGVDALERARDEADAALERHEAELAEAVAEREAALDDLERMDRGEDEAYAEVVAFLTSELEREDLRELRREALATPRPEDDVVVARLLELEAERERLAEEAEDLREVAEGARERLREIQELVRGFAAQRFDEPGSRFPDEDLVTTLLTQFLMGAASRHLVLRTLEGQRRAPGRRSSPTFGSGGFGRGSPWRGGRVGTGPFGGGLGGGSFGGGRASGGLRGGGFRTGGTMRGGGFRTGGKR